MIYLAYSLLDNKTGHYLPPFFMNHRGSAIRAVIDLAQDNRNQVGRHPADFLLCEVGVFDDQTGQLRTDTPIPIGTVLSLLPTPPLDMFKTFAPGNGAAEETA